MLRFLRDITFLLTLCVVSCDSLSGDPEPALPPAGDSKTALAQAWYEEALVRTQTRMGKQEHPAVLAAMVKQYPPDWSQAVSLPIGSGITRVTTVLGPQRPATTRFAHHPGRSAHDLGGCQSKQRGDWFPLAGVCESGFTRSRQLC